MTKNPDNPDSKDERRSAPRRLRSESVSVQVLQPCDDGSCPARVIDTQTVDVSAYGMRLLVSERLDTGRIFDICVELRDHPRRFLLTGETRWCRYHPEQGGFELGIEIREGEGTDFLVWGEMIAAGGCAAAGADPV